MMLLRLTTIALAYLSSGVLGNEDIYQYTIHYVSKTWNEARQICSRGDAELLSIPDQLSWEMWKHVLNPAIHNVKLHEDQFWFGLHAMNREDSDDVVWDRCESPVFTEPLAQENIMTEHGCVQMWIHYEVFVAQFLDVWVKRKRCDVTLPFVCSTVLKAPQCLPGFCDELVFPMQEEMECLSRGCDVFPDNGATCRADFINEAGLCHVVSGTAPYLVNTSFTLCRLNDEPDAWTTCSDVEKQWDYNVTDTNEHPSNSCHDNSSTSVSTTLTTPEVWSQFRHQFTVYDVLVTWNDARDICSTSGSLFTIQGRMAMLLHNSILKPGDYWCGLHVFSVGESTHAYWDDCTGTESPEVTEHVTGSCGYLQDSSFKLSSCDIKRPFVCDHVLAGDGDCFSSTCDQYTFYTPEQECTDTVCDDLNLSRDACNVTYLSGVGLCSVSRIPTVQPDDGSKVICYLPGADVLTNFCQTAHQAFPDYTPRDTNRDVTDKKCFPSHITPSPRHKDCDCDCDKLRTFLTNGQSVDTGLTVEEKVDKIISELTVDKKNTTVNRRKYVSAMDNRTSAVSIGAAGGLVIMAVMGTIVVIDLSRLLQQAKHIFKKLFISMKKRCSVHGTRVNIQRHGIRTPVQPVTVVPK